MTGHLGPHSIASLFWCDNGGNQQRSNWVPKPATTPPAEPPQAANILRQVGTGKATSLQGRNSGLNICPFSGFQSLLGGAESRKWASGTPRKMRLGSEWQRRYGETDGEAFRQDWLQGGGPQRRGKGKKGIHPHVSSEWTKACRSAWGHTLITHASVYTRTRLRRAHGRDCHTDTRVAEMHADEFCSGRGRATCVLMAWPAC